MAKLEIYDKEDLDKILSEAYLNVKCDESTLSNPLAEIPEEFQDNPEIYIAHLLSQPDYFSFTCDQILNVKLLPFQAVILKELWTRRFPMLVGCRGLGKTFILAVYSLLLLLFTQNSKIILCSVGFRQSKLIFSYMQSIINNSSILRNMFPKESITLGNESWTMRLGNSYCRALPLGFDGSKVRGQRATHIISDEQASMLIDVFETVIAGFAAVSASPFFNVQAKAKQRLAIKLGIELDETELKMGQSNNQIVIAGTAYYDYNHFSQYHKRWLQIIKSRGDVDKLKEIFGDKYQEGLNWKDYSVIRIPYELIPEGFMDDAQVSRSRATMSESNFLLEYGACFLSDSDGFFKNTLINQCTVGFNMKFVLPTGRQLTEQEFFFEPQMYGEPQKQYVYGIDPASRLDNFSIVVLEDCGDFRKIVHVWVTSEKDLKEKREMGITKEHNFYAYCCRKIRELMKTFPCKRMAIDSQGGGIAVMENFKDKDKLLPGEMQLWPIQIPGKPQPTDGEPGRHIIEPIAFASDAWTSEANHGMKKDFEDGVLLFPYIDGISISLADVEEENKDPSDNTLNNVIFNIGELKQELITIIVTETATGREHFDTPEVKTGTGRKGRMKKDRYSALLMANSVARNLAGTTITTFSTFTGGFAGGGYPQREAPKEQPGFTGPSWIVSQLADLYN